jgi:hypothetical protein
MGLVRCPKHKIPYNEDNPRGCPACAREQDAGGDDAAIRELQRASRIARGVEEAPRGIDEPLIEFLTPQPEQPARKPTRLERAGRVMRRHRYLVGSLVVIGLLVAALYALNRPEFVVAPDPPLTDVEPRPLVLQPNAGVSAIVELLGPQQPVAVPGRPELARYAYGERLSVDVRNGRVQVINVGVANRSWRGVTVGVSENAVRGALALLGEVQEERHDEVGGPSTVAGHRVYPSLEDRPSRVLSVAVRPPNGCFDVEVTLRPRVAGILVKDDTRYASLGRGDVAVEWASTQYRVINRELLGAGSPTATCPQ